MQMENHFWNGNRGKVWLSSGVSGGTRVREGIKFQVGNENMGEPSGEQVCAV